MKTVLICHAGDSLNEVGLARWLGSFSDLAGMVVIHETRQRMWRRIRREIGRVGLTRFPDVLAFRVYYRLMHASHDRRWEEQRLGELCETYPSLGSSVRTLHTTSPNSSEVVEFMRQSGPDIVIARCKTLLKETVFSVPRLGTFVMHPGICPEYRNAHGCFWALANGDYDRVGMTLLRVDKGVDTGAVYGYYTCNLDDASQSHIVIQHRVVFDNLDALRSKFEEIYSGRASTIDTSGRQSATWGQPWLTRQIMISRRLRKLREGILSA
jgi:folate-dependent phosphoribosylglycinamide formyltransferase PurN